MVWGGFAVPMQICSFSLLFQYLNINCTSLDSQRKVLYNDLFYGNEGNEIKVYTLWEFENWNFQ